MPVSHSNRYLFAVVAALVVLANTGCQSMRKPTVFSKLGPLKAKEAEFVQPHRIAVIWTEDSLPALRDKKGTRGFGGRVYFYDAQNNPVRVDGELTVYAYDDSGEGDRNSIEASRKPDRKYVFLASEFQKRYSESAIGPSYNVFIPWDEAGGPRKTVSLVPIFRPTNGQLVGSGHSIAMLRGKMAEEDEEIEKYANQVRQTSATIPGNVSDSVTNAALLTENAASLRRTTTINMPRSLGRQLASGASVLKNHSSVATGNQSLRPAADSAEGEPKNETDSGTLPAESAITPLNQTARPAAAPVFGNPGPVR